MQLAPIAFFAYKRPEHTLKALTALSECALAQTSVLYIFCDGPKREEDRINVAKVREVIASRQWCREVIVDPKTDNVGLANSVIDGVSKLCDKFGKVIVIEDDLIVSRGFLDYMNRALDLYSDYPQVMQISGHCFPFSSKPDAEAAFFMPISTSWGWATWKRAWNLFDPDAGGYRELAKNTTLRECFDLGGISPYSQMLLNQMSGKLDSWAIRWWWSFFRNNGLCLYPGKSLVKNIGFGDEASNTISTDNYHDDPQWSSAGGIAIFPDRIEPNLAAFASLKAYFRASHPPEGRGMKILRRIKTILTT